MKTITLSDDDFEILKEIVSGWGFEYGFKRDAEEYVRIQKLFDTF